MSKISQLLLAQDESRAATTTTSNTLKYQIHPVVILNILDHFSRRSTDQNRVIGALLGEYKEGFIEIKNCFPVRHSETNEEISIDIDFYKTMYELHHKVYPNDSILGWYGTGVDVSDDDLIIHEVFHKNIKQNPVFVLVGADVASPKNFAGISVKGFMNKPLVLKDKVIASHFKRIQLSNTVNESERIGLSTLVRNQQQVASKKTPSALISELDQLELAMTRLSETLSDVNSYVQNVINGKEKGSAKIARVLSDALQGVPQLSVEQFEKDFNEHLQDLLMVIYLSNLMRTQLSLAEKLTSTL